MAAQRAQEMVQTVRREQQQAQRMGNQGYGGGQGQQAVNGLPSLPQPGAQQMSQRAHAQPPFKQEARPNPVSIPQTDGAGDADERRSDLVVSGEARLANMNKADRIIKRLVESGAQRLEAGGLLVPLDERPVPRTQQMLHSASREQPSSALAEGSSQPARFDGADSDDEDANAKSDKPEVAPTDAITSDLDDSDEDAVIPNIDDDEDGGDTILCLYDKVQRTKNKWKCTLKDGVVSVEGKDYVFHKATGEFEW